MLGLPSRLPWLIDLIGGYLSSRVNKGGIGLGRIASVHGIVHFIFILEYFIGAIVPNIVPLFNNIWQNSNKLERIHPLFMTSPKSPSTLSPPLNFDITIIGGGLVGYSLATALAKQFGDRLAVALVESTPQPDQGQFSYSPSFDDRSTALSLGSKILLHQWGLWDGLSPQGAAIEQIEVSEQGGIKTATLANDNRTQPYGYVLPNRWIGQVLVNQAQHLPTQFFYDQEISRLQFNPQDVTLFSGEQPFANTKLVILAEGGRSPLKQQLGILDQQLDFQQRAFVANVETRQPHNQQAFERFTESGPMALLPLKDPHHSALVWSVDNRLAPSIEHLDLASFSHQANEVFGYRLGAWKQVSAPASYPLTRKKAFEQVRSRLVCIGNSAVTLHPVAGQGLNLALRAVQAFVVTLTEAMEADSDPGNLSTLQAFAERVTNDQDRVTAFCDGIVKGFGIDAPGSRWVRALGLGLLDQHSVLKSLFAEHAMGMASGQLHATGQ